MNKGLRLKATESQVLGKQVLRSGTPVGAHVLAMVFNSMAAGGGGYKYPRGYKERS